MAPTLLTAQQVHDLLDVDTSTVYRMASDGRLPALRIGRQWRFPADAIDALLVPRAGASQPTSPPGGGLERRVATSPAAALPAGLATATLEAVAPVLGVSMVVTDLSGRPMTPVVNAAPAIASRLDDPDFLAACTAEWRTYAHDPDLAPRLRLGRFGFQCAHALVRHGSALIAMVLAGGIAPDGDPGPGLHHLDADRRAALLGALPRTAALLSRLVHDGASSPPA